MYHRFLFKSLLLLVIGLSLSPVSLGAQAPPSIPPPPPVPGTLPTTAPTLVSPTDPRLCKEVPLPDLPGLPVPPCASPAAYIQYWFYLGLYIGGIMALMAIVGAGAYRVMFAYGPGQVATANKYLTNAVLGMIILFIAWLILRTLGGINYTTLRDPVLPPLPFPDSYGEGVSCTKDGDCKSPARCVVSTVPGAGGVCVNGSQGDYCVSDSDCASGLVCIDPLSGSAADEGCGKPPAPQESQTCTAGGAPTCPSSFYCGDGGVEHLGSDYCQDGSYGDICNSPGTRGECQTGLVCKDTSQFNTHYCLPL